MTDRLSPSDEVVYQGFGFVITPNTVTLGRDAWAVRNIASVHPKYVLDREPTGCSGSACVGFCLLLIVISAPFWTMKEGQPIAIAFASVGGIVGVLGLYLLANKPKAVPCLIIHSGGIERIVEFNSTFAMNDVLKAITAVMSSYSGNTINATQVNVYQDHFSSEEVIEGQTQPRPQIPE